MAGFLFGGGGHVSLGLILRELALFGRASRRMAATHALACHPSRRGQEAAPLRMRPVYVGAIRALSYSVFRYSIRSSRSSSFRVRPITPFLYLSMDSPGAASKECPKTLLPWISLPSLPVIENRVSPVLQDESPAAATLKPTCSGSKSRAPMQNCLGRSAAGLSIQ